jgi:hypothetical protein
MRTEIAREVGICPKCEKELQLLLREGASHRDALEVVQERVRRLEAAKPTYITLDAFRLDAR